MAQRGTWRTRAGNALLWIATIGIALGIGVAGVTKFVDPERWQPLFVAWGYPPEISRVVGAVEIIGAIALVIPRLAFYAAALLGLVMAAALLTLLRHPAGPFGWGATPATYLVLLIAVGIARHRQRVAAKHRTVPTARPVAPGP